MAREDAQYGPAADLWSAGVVLFTLLSGYPPFYGDSDPVIFGLIVRGEFSFNEPVWDGVTMGARDLIQRLLTVDPRRRLTARQALAHPWMMGFDQAA